MPGFLDPLMRENVLPPGPSIGPNLGSGVELQSFRNILPNTGPMMNPGLGGPNVTPGMNMSPNMMANSMRLSGPGKSLENMSFHRGGLLAPMNSLRQPNMRAGGTGLGSRPGQTQRARKNRGAGIGMF